MCLASRFFLIKFYPASFVLGFNRWSERGDSVLFTYALFIDLPSLPPPPNEARELRYLKYQLQKVACCNVELNCSNIFKSFIELLAADGERVLVMRQI